MLIQHILATKGTDVVSVASTTSVADAVSTLRERRIGAVVVSDDGGASLTGILSERDIVRGLGEHGAAVLDQPVSALMTTEIFSCDPTFTAEQLMALMTERRIRHVPIIEDGRLQGVISIGDVVKHRLHELAVEAQTLHDYVTSGL